MFCRPQKQKKNKDKKEMNPSLWSKEFGARLSFLFFFFFFFFGIVI